MLIGRLRKRLNPGTSPTDPASPAEVTQERGRHRSSPESSTYTAYFEPLTQALTATTDPIPAAAAAGRRLAERGVPLADVLDALEAAYRRLGEQEPTLPIIRALCQSWSECSLTYLQAPSCVDPATGLATVSHLRSRLAELYRTAQLEGWFMPDTHALVVAERVKSESTPRTTRDEGLAELAGHVRTVFSDAEVIARLGRTRVATVVRLEPQLTEHLGTLRSLVGYRATDTDQHDPTQPRAAVSIEPLPTLAEWSDSFINDLADR